MNDERTLVLIKPDGVQRLLVGEILSRYERRGLKVVGMKMIDVEPEFAERHYAVHRDKPFFAGLVKFISASPVVAIVLEGPNAVAAVRALNGATRPVESPPGTIRGDLALTTGPNLVHGSDSPENAQGKISLWFTQSELHDYDRALDSWIREED